MKLLQMEKKQPQKSRPVNLDQIVKDVDKVFDGSSKIDEAIKIAGKSSNDSFNLNTAIKKANQNFDEIQKN